MSASRRLQRSVRVSVAVGLLAFAAVVVMAAVVSSTWVSAAAVFSLLAGATSSRIIYTEVIQTRRHHAIERAELARNFGHVMTKSHHEHQAFTTTMSSRLAAKDNSILELNATIRLAELRADEAELRLKHEAKRANDAQERLSVLLDEVLTSQNAVLQEVGIPEAADLPTIVDLLAWEDRGDQTLLEGLEDLRHQA